MSENAVYLGGQCTGGKISVPIFRFGKRSIYNVLLVTCSKFNCEKSERNRVHQVPIKFRLSSDYFVNKHNGG